MARRLEFGGGLAAAILAVLGLVALLLAPLPVCDVPSVARCPKGHIHTVSLITARLDSSVWVYVVGMVIFLLAGAAGAIAEARYGWGAGGLVLWAAAILAFMGCSIGAGGVPGLMYLPGVLALLLAGYASVLRRIRETGRQSTDAARRPRP